MAGRTTGKHVGSPVTINALVLQALNECELFTKDQSDQKFAHLAKAKNVLNTEIPHESDFAAFVNKNSDFYKTYTQLKEFVHNHQSDELEHRFQKLRRSSKPQTPQTMPGKPSTPPGPTVPYPMSPSGDQLKMPRPQTPPKSLDELSPAIVNNKLAVSKVLLLDVRPRSQFEAGHIDCPLIACFEPSILRNGMSIQDLEDQLVIAPDSEAQSFTQVGNVDLIVLYDEFSTSKSENIALERLTNALHTRSYVLRGGYKAWLHEFPSRVITQQQEPVAVPEPAFNLPKVPPKVPINLQNLQNSHYADPSGANTALQIHEYPPIPPPHASIPQFHPDSPYTTHQQARPPSNSTPHVPSHAPPEVPPVLRPHQHGYVDSPIPRKSLRVPKLQTKAITHYVEEPVSRHLLSTGGLQNLGNTCYMNCVLQCLVGIPQLVEPFSTPAYKQMINLRSRLGHNGRFAGSFSELVMQMLNTHSNNYVRPIGIKNMCIALRPESFGGFEQQDCQEFLTFMLDGIHEDLNSCGDRPKEPALSAREEAHREKLPIRLASAMEWDRYRHGDSSLIVDLFQGQLLSRLQCVTCKHTSSSYSAFSSLSLPLAVPKLLGQHTSLKSCFDEFVKPEVLDGDNAWLCPHCRQKRKAIKTLQISRLPPYLIIHFKRFKRSVMGTSTKLETPVSYPLRTLDLTKYWPNDQEASQHNTSQQPPFIYDLRAVMLHQGSLRGGHYTAVVYKPGIGWHYFDDANVTSVKEQAAVSKNAYVLVYRRRM